MYAAALTSGDWRPRKRNGIAPSDAFIATDTFPPEVIGSNAL